VKRADLSY